MTDQVATELTTIQPRSIAPAMAVNESLPEFMRGESGDNGMGAMAQYVVPPFLKVVQKQAADTLLQQFNIGDVILSPANAMVAPVMVDPVTQKPTDNGSPFHFVPLFGYPEFIVINPYELKGQLNFIRERTTDPKSQIAAMARNLSASKQPCPEDARYNIRYCECLNWIVVLINHELAATPALLSFSRGSFKDGQAFSTLLAMRLRTGGKMWGVQAEGRTVKRKNTKTGDEYRVISASNPSGDSGIAPWVQDKEWYEWYTYQAQQFADLHAAGQLQANYDDDAQTVDAGAQPALDPNAPPRF